MHSYDVVFYAVTRNATCLQRAAPELKNNGGRESARAHPPTAARPLPACVIACGRPQPMRGLSPPYGHMAVPARRPSTTQTWPRIMARFAGGVHRLSLRRCSSWPRASSKQHPAPDDLEASIAASFAGGVYRLCLQWSVPPAPVASSTDRLHQRQPTAPRRHILFTFDQVSPQLGAAIAESPVALAWPIAAR